MKKTLLIVDDDQVYGNMLCDALKKQSYEVVYHSKAQEALDFAMEQKPCVMLVDWLMPEMDGLELAKKAREANPFVQIIMISVDPSLENMVKIHDAGLFDYMIKPLNVKRLRQVIREAFVHGQRWRTSLDIYSKQLKTRKAKEKV